MRLLKQLDRIVLEVPDVALWHDFFTETLRLPEAWPPTRSDPDETCSSGIYVGDVALELLHSRAGILGRAPVTEPALAGLAFLAAVDCDDLPLILSTVGLHCHYEAALPLTTALPTLVLDGLMGGEARLFVSQHGYDTEPWQRHLRQQFLASGGGTLGITGVAAVVVGLADVERGGFAFRHLRPPSDVVRNMLQFDIGPALRFVPHEGDALLALDLEVRSVAAAAAVLQQAALPPGAAHSATGLRAGAVELRLVQRL